MKATARSRATRTREPLLSRCLHSAGREAIYSAGYLALAPVFTKRLMSQKGWEESFFASAVLGSMAAGVLANLTSHPVDTVKTVIQASRSKAQT